MFNLLREANDDDHFILYLNNYGGQVNTGLDIINSMRACNGKVMTCMTGPCYSMAPLIILAANEIFVEDDTFMMFHDYSSGIVGKGSEMHASIAAEKPHFDNLFTRLTDKFLTTKEQRHILKGQDLYLNKDQIIKRLKRMKKLGNGSK